jgi:hypothetical protein
VSNNCSGATGPTAVINQCRYSIAAINQCTYSIAAINQCTYSIAAINQCITHLGRREYRRRLAARFGSGPALVLPVRARCGGIEKKVVYSENRVCIVHAVYE